MISLCPSTGTRSQRGSQLGWRESKAPSGRGHRQRGGAGAPRLAVELAREQSPLRGGATARVAVRARQGSQLSGQEKHRGTHRGQMGERAE